MAISQLGIDRYDFFQGWYRLFVIKETNNKYTFAVKI